MHTPRRHLIVAVALAAIFVGCRRDPGGERNFQKGLAYFQEQKFAPAAGCFELAVAAVPGHAPAWNFLGVCQLETGNTAAGLKSLDQALKLDPNYSAAHYNLGVGQLEHGQAEAAIIHLRQAAPAAAVPADVLFQLGRAYQQAGALPQAEQTFTKYLAQHPTAADALNELGTVHVRQRNYTRAEDAFKRSRAADAKFAPAAFNLAWLEQHHLGRPRDALTHYQQYLDLLPKNQQREDVRLTIVELTREVAAPAKVAKAVPAKPATNIVPVVVTPPAPPPPTPALPEKKEVVVVTTPQPPPPPVKKTRTPVATKAPAAGNRAKAAPLFNEGVKLHQQRNLTGAIAIYTKAVAADPSFATAQYNLAIAYRDAGQVEKAFTHYEYALLTDPKYTDARYNYALLLQQQGYTDDAAGQFEEILKTTPKDAGVHLSLATIYAHDRTSFAKAREHYEAYLKLQPNSPLARDIRAWLDKNR
jgi:tetratricopeptide (TPR) repeat protein